MRSATSSEIQMLNSIEQFKQIIPHGSLMNCRQSESVLAVDVAQAFIPVDASLADIISGMLAQAVAPKAADLDMLPPPDADETTIDAPPVSPSACELRALPKHFMGRDDAVDSLVAFMATAAPAGVMLHGGPGQVCSVNCSLKLLSNCSKHAVECMHSTIYSFVCVLSQLVIQVNILQPSAFGQPYGCKQTCMSCKDGDMVSLFAYVCQAGNYVVPLPVPLKLYL